MIRLYGTDDVTVKDSLIYKIGLEHVCGKEIMGLHLKG